MVDNTTDTPVFITGWRFRIHQARVLLRAWQLARRSYPNMTDAWNAIRKLTAVTRQNNQIRHVTKGARIEGRIFSMLSMPGFPSPAMDTLLRAELHRCLPVPGYSGGLLLLILAMTKKCSLRCEHCFEWEALNHKEVLAVEDILAIIRKFQERGLAVAELSGGEPINRFDDLLEILRRTDTRQTDFWILTSGYLLNAERARQLKANGLTGVSISLDHWNPAAHDHFRGLEGSFGWAVQAAANAREAGLAVGLTLVPTHDFCTREHLMRYLHLAKELRVHFVRILEPRAVGHYAGKAVELEPAELAVLEDFYREIQYEKRFAGFPVVEYHGAFQRKVGCGGGGKRFLYIDTDGDFHACPFCQHKCGNAVNGSVEAGLEALQHASGCHAFQNLV